MTGSINGSTAAGCLPGCSEDSNRWWRSRLMVGVSAVMMAATVVAEDSPEMVAPSPELLEFLAEFGHLDEQTFELIVFHGLDDADKQQAEPAQSGSTNTEQTSEADHDR